MRVSRVRMEVSFVHIDDSFEKLSWNGGILGSWRVDLPKRAAKQGMFYWHRLRWGWKRLQDTWLLVPCRHFRRWGSGSREWCFFARRFNRRQRVRVSALMVMQVRSVFMWRLSALCSWWGSVLCDPCCNSMEEVSWRARSWIVAIFEPQKEHMLWELDSDNRSKNYN